MELKKTLASLFLVAALALPGVAAAVERININTADAAAFDRVMDGVGPAKAAAIVKHRRVHGPFRSIDQLIDVRGIGLATLERNRARLAVAAAPAVAARPVAARAAAAPQTAARRAPQAAPGAR